MVGERIRALRTMQGLTQKELGERCGMADSAIRRYESDRGNPTQETLQRIAAALGVSVSDLLGQEEKPQRVRPWGVFLQEKLASVGCSLGVYEEDAYIWINYPDGTLEITEADLKELDASTDAFLRFQLYELREKRKKDFRPNRKRPATAGQDGPVGVSPAPGDTDTSAAETPTEGPPEGE